MEQPLVHLVMGVEETFTVSMALGHFVRKASKEIKRNPAETEAEVAELMEVLELKLAAAEMFRTLLAATGMPQAQIEKNLADMERV